MRRATSIALWSGGTIVFLIVAVLVAIAWVLFTTSGARWAGDLATSRFAPTVRYGSLDGTIAGIWRPRKAGRTLTLTVRTFSALPERHRAALQTRKW